MTPSDEQYGDRHADELLSAHLDAELDPATEAWVESHLATCETCRDAAGVLAEARSLVRSLPPVESRGVVERFLARHRRAIRTGAGFVGVAAVMLGALALTAAVQQPEVVPDLDALTAAHLRAMHGQMDGMHAVDDAGGGYAAPPGLIGNRVRLSRHAIYDGSDITAVLYRDAGVSVSVFEQPGSLDWGRLPAGRREQLNGHVVWWGRAAPPVAVTELGDLVVTVVSEDRSAVLTALAGLPERHRSSRWDRLHDACQRFTEVFTLGR